MSRRRRRYLYALIYLTSLILVFLTNKKLFNSLCYINSVSLEDILLIAYLCIIFVNVIAISSLHFAY